MTFSETLVELDLSESQVQSAHLDLLLVRCSQLKVHNLLYYLLFDFYIEFFLPDSAYESMSTCGRKWHLISRKTSSSYIKRTLS